MVVSGECSLNAAGLERPAGSKESSSFYTCCARMEETGSLVTSVPRLSADIPALMLPKSLNQGVDCASNTAKEPGRVNVMCGLGFGLEADGSSYMANHRSIESIQ